MGGYVIVMAVFTCFGVMLVHANADQELSFDARVFFSDLRWGLVIALLNFSEGLAARSIVMDRAARDGPSWRRSWPGVRSTTWPSPCSFEKQR